MFTRGSGSGAWCGRANESGGQQRQQSGACHQRECGRVFEFGIVVGFVGTFLYIMKRK